VAFLWINIDSVKMLSFVVFAVINPADGSIIGSVPDMAGDDASHAVEAAYKAFQTWKLTTAKVVVWNRYFICLLLFIFFYYESYKSSQKGNLKNQIIST